MRRGQEFTVFKLVIAAAFAMVMLGLIVGVTQYIEGQAFGSSAFGTTFSLLKDAINGPGSCFFRERVVFFQGDAFSEDSLKRAGLENIDVNMVSTASAISCGGKSCTASEKAAVPVVATCNAYAVCQVWYGKDTCA
jgi:hypothetical protein